MILNVFLVLGLGAALSSAAVSWKAGVNCNPDQHVTDPNGNRICSGDPNGQGQRIGTLNGGNCNVNVNGASVSTPAGFVLCAANPGAEVSWVGGSGTCDNVCANSGGPHTEAIDSTTAHPANGDYHVAEGNGEAGWQQDGQNGDAAHTASGPIVSSKQCLCYNSIVSHGCWVNQYPKPPSGTNDVLFPAAPVGGPFGGNVAGCLAACEAEGWPYAGLHDGQCQCGWQSDLNVGTSANPSDCSNTCSVTPSFQCGDAGSNFISVYGHNPLNAPPPLGPINPPNTDGVTYIGCWRDNLNRLLLGNPPNNPAIGIYAGPGFTTAGPPTGPPPQSVSCQDTCNQWKNQLLGQYGLNITLIWALTEDDGVLGPLQDCYCADISYISQQQPENNAECYTRTQELASTGIPWLGGHKYRLAVYQNGNGGYGDPWAGPW